MRTAWRFGPLAALLIAPLIAPLIALSSPALALPDHYGQVDEARVAKSAEEKQNWLLDGRDAGGTFFSPLTGITDKNAGKLGLAWEYRTGTYRGMEATPIVVDGVMYATGTWGVVYALNAATGKPLWTFDPEADQMSARAACCDSVNRGVAVWKGKVYVASLDGKLFALDAETGKKIWVADTIEDHKQAYSSTGAPRIAGKVVVIGNAGADMGFGGVRGYVSGYDLETGAQVWRFYTVPSPKDENPSPAEKAAAATWDPKRDPRVLGGATAWNGTAYDATLNLVYFGTGNPAPYQPYDRNPTGNFDNLYSDCIVALNADTGELAWYYQATPSDNWDFDAVAKLVIADLTIDGQVRKTIMQADKNGYFYVLDRATGKPISATPFIDLNWSSGMDANFRPIVSPQADYEAGPKVIKPMTSGAHEWVPMSYSPKTGLVYIPVMDMANLQIDMKTNGAKVPFIDGFFNVAAPPLDVDFKSSDNEEMLGKLPNFPARDPKTGKSWLRGLIKAWDPVKQKVVWQQQVSTDYYAIDGGTTSTAGNLVFAGRDDGKFVVYAADTGKILKVIETGSSIMAAPSVYEVDGVEYVSVLTGHGGTLISFGTFKNAASYRYVNENRILTFKIGGAPKVPFPAKIKDEPFRKPPAQTASPEQIAAGEKTFLVNCSRCHIFGPNIVPDLRHLSDGIDDIDTFKSIVLRGALLPMGMARFDDLISDQEASNIHAYLVDLSTEAYKAQERHKKH